MSLYWKINYNRFYVKRMSNDKLDFSKIESEMLISYMNTNINMVNLSHLVISDITREGNLFFYISLIIHYIVKRI